MTKRIVCLANSRKLHGRCIAGREVIEGQTPGPWIRPVSDRLHEEVSEYERQYQDGSDPHVLDIIDVPLKEPRPRGHQQENWLLDPEAYWARVGLFGWNDLAGLADDASPLWLNGYSTYNGENDYLPVAEAEGLGSSLKLAQVDSVQVRVFAPSQAFGNSKRRVQARFSLGRDDYALWITDPIIERRYLAKQDGTYDLSENYLTISLSEGQNDRYYKLLAAVIPPHPTEGARPG